MDPETLTSENLQVLAADTPLDTTIIISSDFRTVRLSGDLPPNTAITLVATPDVVSLYGKGLTEYRTQFRTSPEASSRPSVSVFPAIGAGNVPSEAPILVDTGMPLDTNSAIAASKFTQNGEPVAGAIRVEGGTVRFIPYAPFLPGAVIAVSIGTEIRDTSGNSVPACESAFVTSGTKNMSPTPIGAFPIYSREVEFTPAIEVEFDRPLNPDSVNDSNVTLRTVDGNPVPAAVTLRDARIVRLMPDAPLMADSLYEYEISTNVLDLTGASPASSFRRSLRTRPQPADVERATAEITPRDGSPDVAPSSTIAVHFPGEINPISVTGETVRMTTFGGGVIPCSIAFGDRFHEIILSPLQPLPEGATITVTMAGVETGSGAVIAPRVMRFFTRMPRPVANTNKRSTIRASSTRESSVPASVIGPSGGEPNVTLEKPVGNDWRRR